MNRIVLSLLALTLAAAEASAQTALQLRGTVTDPSGASIPGAAMTLTGPNNTTKKGEADAQGRYALTGLTPGKFTLRVSSTGFAPFERIVNIGGDKPINFDITLKLAIETQQITVSDTSEINLDPSDPTRNVGALVLKGEDLEALSDNPDDLQNDLQALAGPSAGPNGGQIFIDGFSGGRLPPKESIREVRVNSNPFSAEYDKLGFGRIEILTKPGTDKFRGSAFFNFTDAVFNARNPYSTIRPPYQQKFFGGNLSGPVTKKSSFFIEVDRRMQDEAAAINALTVDPTTFQPTPFSTAILNPQTRTTVNPRFDYQINTNNTLVARYEWTKFDNTNTGLTALTLPSQATNSGQTMNTLQLTETAVLSPKAINETRFQYLWTRLNQNGAGDSTVPGINVLGSFNGGGSPFNNAYNNDNRWELTNSTSITHGAHAIKVGARIRGESQSDYTTRNYNGTYTFSTLLAYQLQLEGIANGLTNEQIRAMGGGPSQFTLTGGIPLASVSQYDLGAFITDDWRIKPNFTLSTGLRYETQNNISSHFNFAPRIGIAWGIGKPNAARATKTVLRAGWGIFYDRFDETYTLQADRINPLVQQQYVIARPNFYPQIPTSAELAPYLTGQTTQTVYAGLQAPSIMQGMMSIERQLPKNTTLAVTYVNSRGVHMLRQRNINAPLPGTYDPADPTSGVRPYGNDAGNIFLYESSGSFRQNQMIVNSRTQFSKYINLFGFYMLNSAKSNTDGVNTFPADTYDLSSEWGRAQFDIRHRAIIGGSINTWKGISFNPFIIAQSGPPFNITVGRDLNGDTLFTERPYLVPVGTPGSTSTAFGNFSLTPVAGASMIARNDAQAPGQLTINLRASKTWGWGERTGSARMSDGPGPRGGGPGGMVIRGGGGPGGGGGGGGMRGGGFGGGASSGRKYSLTFSVSARNLLNAVNPGLPIGNLTSPRFGESNALAGGMFASATTNRRIDLQLRFSF